MSYALAIRMHLVSSPALFSLVKCGRSRFQNLPDLETTMHGHRTHGAPAQTLTQPTLDVIVAVLRGGGSMPDIELL